MLTASAPAERPENQHILAGRQTAAEKTAAAQSHYREHDDTVILGADTTVVVDDEILGKPRDDEDARGMLRRLSGRVHEVLTGVSLRHGAYEVGTSVAHRALVGDLQYPPDATR